MKKLMNLLVCIMLLPIIFTGCDTTATSEKTSGEKTEQTTNDSTGNEESTNENDNTEGKYVMRVGHAQSLESPRHRSMELFKKLVEEKTNGNVTVEIYPEGELGNETEMTVDVSDGELEAVRGGDLEFAPKTTMLGLPMIADNIEEARKLCYSDFLQGMLSSTESDYNMKVLAVGDDSGFRQITNNVRPITKPSDMKGLKMRTVLEVIDLSMHEFGASTVAIPFTELYPALANGTVDGQENPLALIDSNHFYEVQKYCTIIDYMFFPELMYVNLDWWNSLPAEYQDIITESAKEMMGENARITDEENNKYIEHISENGCEIYVLSPEEREEFKPLAQRVWQDYVDSGRISKQELDDMLAVIGKHAE
ncbi:MAG: TRAP transporter substrate-binding protein, partial [Firmicutes bacterium]|nr:TRAP transporter substrate-binding protein [Bacillota bacterium]